MNDEILLNRMIKYRDYIGMKFGKLKINTIYIKREMTSRGEQNIKWCKCTCECGKNIDVRLSNLKYGRTTTCGCSRKDSRKIMREKSNKDHEWIKEMYYKQRLSVTDIAKKSGLSRQSVSKYVQRIKRGEM